MTINFFLRDKKAKQKTAIYAKVTWGPHGRTEKLKLSLGSSIEPSNWDAKKQRPKSTIVSRKSEYINLKNKIDRVEGEILELISSYEKGAKRLNPGDLRDFWKKSVNGDQGTVLEKDYMDHFDDFILDKHGIVGSRTIQKYRGLRNHLMLYCLYQSDKQASLSIRNDGDQVVSMYYNLDEKYRLTYEDIDLTFYSNYKKFMIGEGKLDDTIGKNIAVLKVFMKWAEIKGYHNNDWYSRKEFKSHRTKKNENFVLSEEQLQQLFEYEFSSARLNKIKDLFCFMAFTGQRWNEYENFNPDQVKDGGWYVFREKTKDRKATKIPFVGYIEPANLILQRYGGDLPRSESGKFYSAPVFNLYIKEVFKKSGLFGNNFNKVRYSGSKLVKTTNPAYEVVTQYTARRTFCTILSRKIPIPSLMLLSGHTEYSTLLKYVNQDEDTVREELEIKTVSYLSK